MTDMLTGPPAAGGAAYPDPGPGLGSGPGLVGDVEWREQVDEPQVCTEVEWVTHDVKSFVLRPARPRLYRFEPGQYLTLTVSVAGRELDRCYTIASSPLRPDALTITVKRVPGGPVSGWLHDNLRPGVTLPVTGPLGRFSTTYHPARRYLFLSAGSGITPLMSMTRTIHGRGEDADVVFVHSARTPDDIVFRAELERIAADNPAIRVVAVCEEDSVVEQWDGPRGRLTTPMLHAIVPDLADREIFSCGPPPYMAAVRAMLDEAGADPWRCHEESFVLADVVAGAVSTGPAPVSAAGSAPGGPPPREAAATSYAVELRRSNRTIECDATSTILQAAARAGMSLPSSCGEGMCGTCMSDLVGGSVDMEHAGGIRPRQIAANKILLCCSKPLEDLVIDA